VDCPQTIEIRGKKSQSERLTLFINAGDIGKGFDGIWIERATDY
jgi:hypothetical protein